MTANLIHFSINADDVERARRFYRSVFGWTFEAWGPPGFYRISTGPAGSPAVGGALQSRRDLSERGPTFGYECTFAVDDLDATTAAVTGAGGQVRMERFTIEGVGDLMAYEDPEGNPFLALHPLPLEGNPTT